MKIYKWFCVLYKAGIVKLNFTEPNIFVNILAPMWFYNHTQKFMKIQSTIKNVKFLSFF